MSGPAWLWMATAQTARSPLCATIEIRGWKTPVMYMTALQRRMNTARTAMTTLKFVVLQ